MYALEVWIVLPGEFWKLHDNLQEAATGRWKTNLQQIANEHAQILKLLAQGASPSSRVNAAWEIQPARGDEADFGAKVVNTYDVYPNNEHLRKAFWGSLATRFEFGYDGSNPRAGFTPPYNMVTGPFDNTADAFYKRIAAEISTIVFG